MIGTCRVPQFGFGAVDEAGRPDVEGEVVLAGAPAEYVFAVPLVDALPGADDIDADFTFGVALAGDFFAFAVDGFDAADVRADAVEVAFVELDLVFFTVDVFFVDTDLPVVALAVDGARRAACDAVERAGFAADPTACERVPVEDAADALAVMPAPALRRVAWLCRYSAVS